MPQRPRTIRFCVNNTHTLEERDYLNAQGCEMRDCLGRCAACFERRFIALGTEIFEGDTYEDILPRVQQAKAEHDARPQDQSQDQTPDP